MSEHRPQTTAEFASLPIGPAYAIHSHDISDEDIRRGYTEINGNRLDLPQHPTAPTIQFPVAPQLVAFHSDDTDLICYTDADGQTWALGRYRTGQWFRRKAWA